MIGLLTWAALLWYLSSQSTVGPQIPLVHADKLMHFTYFAAGGFLVAGWLFHRKPDSPSWKAIIGCSILAMAMIGGIDEWHQLHTPGRSGGDPWDWLADIAGGVAGAFLLKHSHRWF